MSGGGTATGPCVCPGEAAWKGDKSFHLLEQSHLLFSLTLGTHGKISLAGTQSDSQSPSQTQWEWRRESVWVIQEQEDLVCAGSGERFQFSAGRVVLEGCRREQRLPWCGVSALLLPFSCAQGLWGCSLQPWRRRVSGDFLFPLLSSDSVWNYSAVSSTLVHIKCKTGQATVLPSLEDVFVVPGTQY